MFSGNQLSKRRQEVGLSQAEMARRLNISRPAYHNWETGKTKPNAKNRALLSQILDVVPTYFEAGDPLLRTYLQLEPCRQNKVFDFAQNQLKEQIQLSKEPIQLFPYRVYESLSAGGGHFVSDEHHFDTVYFDQEIDHDIASWIYGDSMEPKYLNGSVALIKETGFDYDGAIYAVVWDGQTYLKKVYREADGFRLVSLNKKYEDKLAPYDESPRIVGKLVGNFIPRII